MSADLRTRIPLPTREELLRMNVKFPAGLPAADFPQTIKRDAGRTTEHSVGLVAGLRYAHELFSRLQPAEALQHLERAIGDSVHDALMTMRVPNIVLSGKIYVIDYSHREGPAIYFGREELYAGPTFDPDCSARALLFHKGYRRLLVFFRVGRGEQRYGELDLVTGELHARLS